MWVSSQMKNYKIILPLAEHSKKLSYPQSHWSTENTCIYLVVWYYLLYVYMTASSYIYISAI